MDRLTQQRVAIRHAFEQADRPLSPQEILPLAQEQAPTLGVATVYRAIKSLVEEGWLAPVSLPGEPDRYELAGKGHHHHFRCRTCGKVFDIPACHERLGDMTPAGFQTETHEIVLFGRCRDCVSHNRTTSVNHHGLTAMNRAQSPQ